MDHPVIPSLPTAAGKASKLLRAFFLRSQHLRVAAAVTSIDPFSIFLFPRSICLLLRPLSASVGAMEHREDEEDAEQAFLHRSFVQEAEVLDALVTSIVQAKGHADPAIFRKSQSIVFISLYCSLSPPPRGPRALHFLCFFPPTHFVREAGIWGMKEDL